MTLTQEFEQQWATLTNTLTSEILRGASVGKSVSHEQLEQIFDKETKRWTVRGQYQYAWFELLNKRNPDVATEFGKALDSTKLVPIIPTERPSSIFTAGPAAGGAVVGFGLAKLMALSTLMTALGTVAIGAMGFGIGKTLQAQKLSNALAKDADAYKAQLQAAGTKLAAIVSRAEQ